MILMGGFGPPSFLPPVVLAPCRCGGEFLHGSKQDGLIQLQLGSRPAGVRFGKVDLDGLHHYPEGFRF
ncbi:MAG: hypothetical protein CFE34_17235 [Rhodobacteraceae bacterium PARR1]|nr:MAG: hypothetical protein CFE34_17235 [Rhodobacteraceae bacterium PARR1]